MKARLLIVDRDARYREWLCQHLSVLYPEGIITALGVIEFRDHHGTLSREDCDLVVLVAPFGASPEDPGSEGLEWLRSLRERASFPPIITIAEDGNELTAVRALQLGAADYLPKRLLTADRLKTAVKLAMRRVEMRASEASYERSYSPVRSMRDPIPGYTIRKTIGESEKAMVYLATSAELKKDVALKVSKSERDEANERQFLARERAAIAAIHHRSIIEIFDYGTHEQREYLAMEYFPRGDLKARLQRGILEVDGLRYLEQIAAALCVVHDAGIMHRDLKPPNVMLRDVSDEIVLIDFGLARNLHGSLQSTRKGVLRGSPYYMSPEQALGEELDPRTDLYSLGIIFYEMLTSRKPYTGTSAIDVLQQHVNAPLPKLPEPLAHHQQLLDGLLAKSREDRFKDAAQVVEAIAGMRVLREAARNEARRETPKAAALLPDPARETPEEVATPTAA
jgi:DNA-binding response OmpR family regulator/tRNA A-37 threonylcarbamoyl transferase component Bud32